MAMAAAPSMMRLGRPARPTPRVSRAVAVIASSSGREEQASTRSAVLRSLVLLAAVQPLAAFAGETAEHKLERQKEAVCGTPDYPRVLKTPFARRFCGQETQADRDNEKARLDLIQERTVISKKMFKDIGIN